MAISIIKIPFGEKYKDGYLTFTGRNGTGKCTGLELYDPADPTENAPGKDN